MTETKMQLVDWLDDLCVRFIINLHQEELESVERICFQVEEAQWFYEDFIRPLDPSLPSLSLRQFCLLIFKHCPLLASFSEYHHLRAFEEFLQYKTRVPVRGAILLNDAMDKVVLVRGWKKGANWSFPRGKINKDEKDLDCAVREVYEETGYDLEAAGLVMDESKTKHIEVTMREQHMKLYVFRGIPEDTPFQPRTRKEISKIQWYSLSSLPGYRKSKIEDHANQNDALSANKIYMVAPFLQPLKKWISKQRKIDASRSSALSISVQQSDAQGYSTNDELPATTHDVGQMGGPTVLNRNGAPPGNDQGLFGTMEDRNLALRAGTSNVDAAADLKRLLSVGQKNLGASAHETGANYAADPNNLLHLLRRGPVAPDSLQERENVPRTPIEQITYQPPAPNSPHHYQPRPPHFSDLAPPPSFPYSPSQFTSDRPTGMPLYAPVDRPLHLFNQPQGGPYSHHHHPQQPPFANPHLHMGSLQEQKSELPSQFIPTGDPHFGRGVELPSSSMPQVPPASTLPAPKLSNHALNLLNAFKSKEKTEVNAKQESTETSQAGLDHQAESSVQNSLKDVQSFQQNQASTLHRHTDSRARQALGITSPTPDERVPQDASNFIAQHPSSNYKPGHQDKLLELFKNPVSSAPVPEISDPEKQLGLRSDPVELSAMPSPGIPAQKLSDHREGQVPVEKLSITPVSPTRNVSQQSGELTSATVPGPPSFPDFASVRRKQKTPKSAGGESLPSPAVSVQQNQGPSIKILKRPTAPSKETAMRLSPDRVRDSSAESGPAELKGSTPTPKALPPNFHPQILKREQPPPSSMPPNPASKPEPTVFDRRAGVSNDQKQTLLSLFNKPALQNPQVDDRPPIASPVSVQSFRLADDSDRPHSRATNSRANSLFSQGKGQRNSRPSSRMNSFPQLPPDSAPAQEQDSRRGSQTPMSPSDRGFLLNYLEGVAKGAR